MCWLELWQGTSGLWHVRGQLVSAGLNSLCLFILLGAAGLLYHADVDATGARPSDLLVKGGQQATAAHAAK